MLPEDQLIFLNDRIHSRTNQIRQIANLLDPEVPSPPVLVLHGLEATGKSLTSEAILASLQLLYAIVDSRECITARHLLERTVVDCKNAVDKTQIVDTHQIVDGRCENVSVLAVKLQQILAGQKKFVLVFDGIDQQREAPHTLLPAIARFGEIISCLTIVLVVTAPRPRFLHLAGVPHIHFTPYDRSESLDIVSQSPLSIFKVMLPGDDVSEQLVLERQEDDAWLWSRFCGAVWDSLGKGAARDIVSFRRICEMLWIPFVQPIRERSYGTREFSKLLVRHRSLLQGEKALVEWVVPIIPEDTRKKMLVLHELPYYTSFLLAAAYLASYNPSRQDQIFFMKAHEKKRRKRAGGTGKGRPSRHRKIQRRLLGPQAFVLERMLAIFHAILPFPIPGGVGDIMIQIATLASSRLIVRASVSGDILDAGTKWRVNVGWEYIKTVARTIRFDVENFLVE